MKYNSKESEEQQQTSSLTNSLNQLDKCTGIDIEKSNSAVKQEAGLDKLIGSFILNFCMLLKISEVT